MSLLPAVDIKELVRSKTDLVALIGESVQLQPRQGGRLFVGLCPFHDDHNPSFNVNPERQTYRCWVCQEGGDCFSYVMKYEGVGFRDALTSLAARAGVELPSFRGEERVERDEKSQLLEVLSWAEDEFHRCLMQSDVATRARQYLRERHFRDETLRDYRLGFAPEGWDWLQERARGRFSGELLQKAGLAKANEPPRMGFRDAFVDRVMFPIHDERGRTISFGGRILPESRIQNTGKYINGTDTPVFHKSRVIFGLEKARDAIRRTGTAVVTEGYVDCIKAHQAGVLNAVGTLGTALTETHVSILKRTAQRVVLVYDGDKAGRDAAVRAIERFLAQDVDLRILTLPDELDPDEYLDAHGAAAFEQLLQTAPEAWAYYLQTQLEQHGDSLDGRARAQDGMLRLMTIVPGMAGSVRENLLLARIAQRLRIREEVTRHRLQELRAGGTTPARRKVFAGESPVDNVNRLRREAVETLEQRPTKDDQLESDLLQILLTCPSTIECVRQEVGVDDFANEAARELLATCFDLWDHGIEPTLSHVLVALECPLLKRLAVWIDDQATQRRLADQLAQEGPADPTARSERVADSEGSVSATATQGVLRVVLDELKWRREVARDRSTSGSVYENLASSALRDGLEILRKRQEFHKKRAVQKPFENR